MGYLRSADREPRFRKSRAATEPLLADRVFHLCFPAVAVLSVPPDPRDTGRDIELPERAISSEIARSALGSHHLVFHHGELAWRPAASAAVRSK